MGNQSVDKWVGSLVEHWVEMMEHRSVESSVAWKVCSMVAKTVE
jgi:hypothetical protein